MRSATVDRLSFINRQFYNANWQSFSDTRQAPWSGWHRLLPIFQSLPDNAIVYDIGCGNGRLLSFLKSNLKQPLVYTGYDNDIQLLKAARYQHLLSKWIEYDVISQQLKDISLKADCICLFGLFHHIPSHKIRQQIINQALELLHPGGYFIATFWQFNTAGAFTGKIRNWQDFPDIDINDLEPGDYLLGWQDSPYPRYAHAFSQLEINKLLSDYQSQQIDSFNADGPNDKANYYVVLQK